jgi:hypothetical protein
LFKRIAVADAVFEVIYKKKLAMEPFLITSYAMPWLQQRMQYSAHMAIDMNMMSHPEAFP